MTLCQYNTTPRFCQGWQPHIFKKSPGACYVFFCEASCPHRYCHPHLCGYLKPPDWLLLEDIPIPHHWCTGSGNLPDDFPGLCLLPLRCHRRHSECLIPLLLRRFIQGKSEKGMGIFPEWQRTFCGTFTDRVLFSVHPRTLDQPSYLT